MSPFLEPLNNFMPHGMCFLWDSSLLWLHVISDSLIALSYCSIPLALWYFTKIGGKLPFKPIIFLFCAFILACGMTHMFNIWTIWKPDYYPEGLGKLFTAVISVITAIALWPLVYKASKLPNSFLLQESNLLMKKEIQTHKTIEAVTRSQSEHLQKANNQLRRLNLHLCDQELRMLELKKEINRLSLATHQPQPYPNISLLT
ncbi:hypothetical protein [Candidatus Nitrospira allomarina]|uniref:Ethylene receptor 1-like N-terminal domain-containing protein n=1 Tax=Candidatus Nitrospira allomarina TaxID=3020900 RepID=A0AA96G8S3_9BACT|nr:hypothetical protein [Candidatus Nitrospira allomarina]WNM56497.1 hypothetical protein PP769_10940 [Candidatus Nitrospira allomarina]